MHTEIPCLVALDRISRNQAHGTVTATRAQLQDLARRLRVVSVTAFAFDYGFQPTQWRGIYRLVGQLRATVDQECVLTLTPVPTRIDTPFNCLCGTPAALAALEDAIESDDDEDPPEAITPDGIDVGEVAIQYLSLALNDYPRASGVSLPDLLEDMGHLQQDNQGHDRQQPFQTLDSLLRPRRK